MNINDPNLQVAFKYKPFAGIKLANIPISDPPITDIINTVTYNNEINF